MDAIIGVVAECVKCAIPPCMRQIGYCIHYKKIVEKLSRKVEDLKNTKTDVQNRVTAAKKNLESIKNVVEAWLKRVEDMGLMNGDEVIDEMIKNHCCKGWCCCCARHSIGRQAEKKIASIDELINEGKSFVDVSYPSPPVGLELMPITGDILSFASRESTRNQVMAALKEEGTYLVGMYGMGGIGKTTLMNQVAKQVIKEKTFDVVVITTVSQNVELKRIQVEIANQLGLNQLQHEDDKIKRAAMLWERLKKEKRILVILDDLWTTDDLDLSDVGIPCGEHDHKGCKVLITSRSLEVCNSMLSQKNIEVGVLSKEDSWHLFKKNAGDVVDSHALQTVANEVVKECGGLPIALVTLGRALRNKDKAVWDDTLDQLRRSDFTYIEGMNSKVFSSIKLSYDHLGNEILKKCFLFCCLFPEDYEIEFDQLLMYVMSDDMIVEDLETLKQVRGTLNRVLDKLIASCLLLLVKKEEDGVISRVRMHDVVRDVAIRIASKEANGIFVKAGVGLRNWPERVSLLSSGKCLRLSLMGNKINGLPDQPELPNLLSLSLEGNRSLKKLHDSFFQSMEALVALDISRTGISSLPTSLSFLVNLRSLYLGYCDLHEIDISVIGKLDKLEILNLSSCELSSLPEEIGGLSNLKLLDLSKNRQLNFIPPNVISRLSRLEELYMLYSFKRWKVEPTGDGSGASLDEVASLKCVQLDIKNDEIKARISIGCGFRIQSYLTAPSPICHSIRVLLARVDDLKLSKCIGLKSVGQLVIDSVGFQNMKILRVERCNEMEYLMSVVEDCEKLKEEEGCMLNTFPKLKELYLERLPKLTIIWKGVFPTESLQYLKVFEVKWCNGLRYIFSTPAMVLALQQLEELRIWHCEGLKGIVAPPEEMVQKDQVLIPPHTMVMFPRLKKLALWSLRNLMTIANGVIMSFGSFQNLEVLYVYGCNSLKHILPIRLVVNGGLPKLKEIWVKECNEMEVIFNEDGGDHDQYNHSKSNMVVAFPHLWRLRLVSLPKLSKFHQGPPILDWPSLQLLKVEECENFKRLPLNHPHSLFPELEDIEGDSERWFEEELEWEDESLKSRLRPFFYVNPEEGFITILKDLMKI